MATVTPVPRNVALKLCADLRAEGQRKWYTIAGGQCWGCIKFSKGDEARMCGGVVACNLVVARYARMGRQGDKGSPIPNT
ncbi:MAG: hypothetical protein NT169_27345 [Chloroflexi bacterium]|nr:hypothetical protein [Chloroflexota bacterium]